MSKWHPIRSKFTDGEMKAILDYMKKHNIKDKSKLIRRAIEDLIGLSIADREREPLTLPPEYASVYNFSEGYRKLIRSPEEQKIFEEYFKKWDEEFWRDHTTEINKKLSEANKMWPAFKEHKSAGRPKSPPRNRGRPRNTGSNKHSD